ncbi:indole-3-glycerol phosphate synthase TrpC [Gordonibacter massiliensis (ex Traore et al. 2017)]|uniref:indole-3-glycerol phosphate synthase TrpC n=1 Tax=Gordonibacter massiliensis (ex Traore et al. 2017) TaxID=1841863 RepID=UPI001C8CA443|nr:indole-3-glycerol phosphate synthase TrpC [Gordonibacter massiliensis (ex Traore et al. 2017)]MBX9034330.1 indole-3-glycerol phosphate synthase TrpC [Gordonibacter massiliensis (ex Traore et al. 2017)]
MSAEPFEAVDAARGAGGPSAPSVAGAESILEKIAARTRERVEDEKRVRSLAEVRRAAEERLAAERAAEGRPTAERAAAATSGSASSAPDALAAARGQAPDALPFERALARPGISFICEVKRASPSKGLIAPDFPYVDIARDYEAAGAAAVSCLTEPFWFQGRDEYLVEIARAVDIPVLRKDFVVDEYMVYGAKALGAQAVLLICSILDDGELAAYRVLCDELRLSALVEAHTEREVERALAAGARVVGVNNRDLATFEVDLGTSRRLRALAGPEALFVAESGIRTRADVARLREDGVEAVLVGEALMRAADKRAALDELRGEGS